MYFFVEFFVYSFNIIESIYLTCFVFDCYFNLKCIVEVATNFVVEYQTLEIRTKLIKREQRRTSVKCIGTPPKTGKKEIVGISKMITAEKVREQEK